MLDQTKIVQDSSGIVGVFEQKHAAQSVYYALHAIQHRGQDAIGIASSDGQNVTCRKGLGLLSEIATSEILDTLQGHISIGQVRMATFGDMRLENVQPSTVRAHQGSFAVVSTGMITNAISLREQMEDEGLIFQGTSDSELLCHLIQRFKGSFEAKIMQTYQAIEGACSFMIATKDCLFVVRDRHGVHSLFMGSNDKTYIFSSETCSFGLLNAKVIREVEPGEMIRLDDRGIHTKLLSQDQKAVCAMEYVYFSRVDSIINQVNVHEMRKKFGYYLAKKETMKADIVISVPDSANSAANRFMNFVSSNFKAAENVGLGQKVVNHFLYNSYYFEITKNYTRDSSNYYLTASDAAGLNNVFSSISSTIGGSDATLTDTATMVDVISQYFQLPENYRDSLKAYTVPFTGADASGNRQWGTNQTDYTTSVKVDGSKVSITGFNYSDNWVGFHTENGTQTAHGSKMVLEIPIQVKDDTVGQVPTNDETNSGILNGNGSLFAGFVSPVVNYAYFTVVPVISSVDNDGKNQGTPGTEKKVRLLDNPTYNLVNEVPDVYLYGGTFDEAACTTVNASVKGQNPMAITPVENEFYYIWEVPNTYLTPRNYNVWRHLPENNGQKTVVRLYPLTAADRILYQQVGFVIDNKDYVSGCGEFGTAISNAAPTLYQTAVAMKNGQHYQTLYLSKGAIKVSNTAIDESGLVSGQHIDDGCLAGIRLDDNCMAKFKSDTGVTFRPYWITLDNVKVYGTTARTCTYLADSETAQVTKDTTTLPCEYVGDTVATQAMSFARSFTMDDSQPVVDESLTVTVVDGSNTTQVKVAPNGSVRDQVAYQAPAGKIFAGWFTDEAYTTPANLDSITQDTTIYAKYVSDSYLDLHYVRNGLFRLRGVILISAVDNPANYQESGIIVDGEKLPVAYAARYRLFYTASGLFGAARNARLMITQQRIFGSGTLEVTPYWVTKDGTTVLGQPHTLHYSARGIWE